MNVLFVRHYHYLSDENSSGKPGVPRLPSNIFLAAAYCESLGFDVSVESLVRDSHFDPSKSDVVVVYTPLLEGFTKHIKYLEKAKKAGKHTICIINDPFENIEQEAIERFDFIDAIVRLNERELVLGKLLKILEKKGCLDEVDFEGVIYRKTDGECINTGVAKFADSIEHLPSTRKFLEKEDHRLYEHLFVEVGRGCPFKCTFCFYRETGHRTRKIEDILDELRYAEGKYNFVWLHDLNMLADREFAKILSNAIIEAGIKVNWGTDGRIELCHDVETLSIMKNAGCSRMALGLESGSEEVLKNIVKGKNLKFLDRALTNLSKAGISPEMNIMVGYPWENQESVKATAEIANKYRISFAQYVRPLRGTPLYEQYKELGLIKKDLTIENYIDVRNYPMFPTLHLSQTEIVNGMKKIKAPNFAKLTYLRARAALKRSFYGFWAVRKMLFS